jgi:hypothetical protein
MASLALSVTQGVLANRFTTSRHGPVLRYVTHCSDLRGVRGLHAAVLGNLPSAFLRMDSSGGPLLAQALAFELDPV